jgi:hypothetical protein
LVRSKPFPHVTRMCAMRSTSVSVRAAGGIARALNAFNEHSATGVT